MGDYANEYYYQNRERILAQQRERYARQREALSARQRERYAENLEAKRQQQREKWARRQLARDPNWIKREGRKEPLLATLYWQDRIREQTGWEAIFDLIEARQLYSSH